MNENAKSNLKSSLEVRAFLFFVPLHTTLEQEISPYNKNEN